MDNMEKRPLKVFLCHASGDKPKVRELYAYLTAEGINAWLDQEKLLPGQDWRMEIPKAVRDADVVIICLSKQSITKEGYVQKEIVFALDIAEEKPDGTIFLIPARLEECTVPSRLERWQWVDLYAESGYIKLLQSLKIRAKAVDATIEPVSYINASEETQRRLEQLYTEGLAAFYTEDWDKACQRFQNILSEAPNHKNAVEKLAEAKRQRDLTNLYKKATETVHAENWEKAVEYLEDLSVQSPHYKDVAQLLIKSKKQKRLTELYTEAKALHAAQQWEAVVKVFEQIASIESVAPDPDGLLVSAQKELGEQQRIENLKAQYSQALHEMDEGNWQTAQNLLGAIHKEDSGFLETNMLLKKVAQKLEDESKKKKVIDEINTLYEQAHGLLRSKKWRNALDKLAEIKKLDADFTDTDRIEEKANKELAQEEQEAERQNQLAALYAEAVKLLKEEKYQEALDKWGTVKAVDPRYPDRQRVRKTAKRKLGTSAHRSPRIQKNLSEKNIGLGWFILIAMIGFGLARLLQQNLGGIFHLYISDEFRWGLRGALQGLIAAWVLGMVEKEWKWKSLIVFGVSWAVIYPVVFWAISEQAALSIISLIFSLAPIISTILSSL